MMKLTGEGGKGSARRNSNEKAYADNWEKNIWQKQSYQQRHNQRWRCTKTRSKGSKRW